MEGGRGWRVGGDGGWEGMEGGRGWRVGGDGGWEGMEGGRGEGGRVGEEGGKWGGRGSSWMVLAVVFSGRYQPQL